MFRITINNQPFDWVAMSIRETTRVDETGQVFKDLRFEGGNVEAEVFNEFLAPFPIESIIAHRISDNAAVLITNDYPLLTTIQNRISGDSVSGSLLFETPAPPIPQVN